MYMPNMELHVVFHCLPLLLVLLAVDAFESNDNVTDSSRAPRSGRRAVRLYSGTRPDPLVCLGEGFQADPVNCAVFYRCMKSGRGRFMSFKFQCAPGTIYDPDHEVCNHPSTVRRAGCGIEHTVLVSDQILDNSEQIPDNAIEEVRQELPSPISTKHPFYMETSSSTVHPWMTSSKLQDISTTYPWLTSPNDQNEFSSITKKQSTAQSIFTQPSFSSTRKQRSTTPRASSVTHHTSIQNGDLCRSEGFMGDSENCRKFYRCISNLRGGYIRYEFMCTESTIWDDDIQSCNHAWAVKRRRCGRGNVNDITDTPENKDQKVPQDYTTHRIISSSPKQQTNYGLLVSQTQQSSSNVTQSQSKTTGMITTVKTNPTTIFPMGVRQTQNYASRTENRKTSPVYEDLADSYNNINMEASEKPASNECSESGFMGDKNDCKKFYRCVDNGRGSYAKYEFSCGEGTVWDPNLEACNHAWAVKECGGKGSAQEAGTTTTSRASSTSTGTSTKSTPDYVTSTTTTKQPQITTEDNEDVGYGTQNQNPTTISTTIQTSSSSSTQVTKQPGSRCSSSGFMGDENDCKKFYRCVDNGDGSFTRFEFICGEGTVWDSNLEACNHAWAVNECGGKGPAQSTGTSTTSGLIMTSTTSTQSTPSYIPPSQTIKDDDENVGYGNQGQETSPTSSTTELTSTSTSTAIEITMQPGNSCTDSGFMGDENDCKIFYRCVDNGDGSYTRYEFSCGEGTVWDSNIEACNHPWAVPKCGGSSTGTSENVKPPTTVTDGTTYTPQTAQTQNDDSDSGYGIQHDENPTQHGDILTPSTTTTTKQPQGFGNDCTFTGFMGDQYDCKKFYRCVDDGNGGFTRYEFTCGEGTVWDPEIEACNHASAVEKCGGTPNNEINKEEETTSQVTTVSSSTVTFTGNDNEIDTGYGQSSSQPILVSSSETPFEENEAQTSDRCKTNGFMGDKNDCKKFYRCVDNGNGGFTRYEFACGEETVWDPKIQACNHQWAVENCKGSSTDPNKEEATTVQDSSTVSSASQSTSQNIVETTVATATVTVPPSYSENNTCASSGFMGDSKNCKKFYRCVDNGNGGYIKYEFTCGDGTVWNQEIQACDHENNRFCSSSGDTSVSKQPENDEMYPNNDPTKQPSLESSTTDNMNEIQTSTQSSATCQSEGFYGDPNNCKKFYRCVDNGRGSFTKYDFTCGDGTVWDQEIQACDHEANSKCRTNSVGDETDAKPTTSSVLTSTSLNTNVSTTTSSTTEQNENQSNQAVPSSNDTCTSEGFYANSKDCRRFYRCVDNGRGGFTKYDFSCGEGTIWVQEIQACDHQDDYSNCPIFGTTKPQFQGEQLTTEQQPSSTSSSTSSSSVTSTIRPETTEKPNDEYQDNQSSSQKDDSCSSEGFYPNKNDCRKFYRCVDNGQGSYTKYDFSCGEGTAWDIDIQTCNHISEVSRCRSSSHEDGQNKPMQDEGVSQTTENSSSTEKTTTSSSENSKPSSKDTCENEGYFGNTNDCTKFYRCVDNGNGGYTKYDFDCGEGTIWDQDVQTCNHPQDVVNPSCNQSNQQPEISSSSTSTTQSSTSNNENTSQTSSNCSQENTTKKPASENVKCEKAGYYPNPNDCKKFYRCVDWDGNGERFSVYHFECGEGTIWDPQLDTCNHEESVYPPRDCSGVHSQMESVHETSTEGSSVSHQPSESTTESSTTTEQSTTSEQTTSQETTTGQSATTEGTTTPQSTTTESDTIQQSTTTESTSTQQTTTTPQSTTTDQTMTQQSSTTESTTTQQSTTEGTTTQQPTESTTSQQSSTTESTTTQQSTTEGTTTQQSTTESTTTQQTSESTTTQQSPTESTATEQTTESTTTQQSSTESTATEQTTESTTTQLSTTDSTTTQQSTTEGATTQQTEDTSLQQSTTTDSTTTLQTTTSEGTTTTDESSTQQSTTSQTDSSETTESTNTEGSAGNQSTTESMSTTETTSNSKECPDTNEDQYLYVCPTSFRRHPKYCNMFYQCTEDDDSHEPKIAVFTCPNNTMYDESKTQCVEESKADKKCDGQIAQRRRIKRLDLYHKEPIVVGREKYSCSSIGYYPFEKTSECSPAFLKCQKDKSGLLRGYVHLCPEGYLYWNISKRCERKASLKDCKTSANDWSRRWEIPVERKNVAS